MDGGLVVLLIGGEGGEGGAAFVGEDAGGG